MKIIKKLMMSICVTVVLVMMTFSVSAMENTSAYHVKFGAYSATANQPYADEIVMKTRIYKGVTQYRRWNRTLGKWVDPFGFTLGS